MAVTEATEQVNVNPAMAPKLTNWANEPSAKDLQGDLEGAKPAHDTFVIKLKRWRDLNAVEGSAKAPKIKGRSQVQPKLIRRQAEWRYSALSEPFNSSEKMFDVSPTTWEDGDAARQNELVLNYQFRSKINRVSFMDNYVRASVDEGTALVRVGWCRYVTKVDKEQPVWTYYPARDEQDLQNIQAAVQLKSANPRQYDETVPSEIKAAAEYFTETQQPNYAVQTGTETVKVDKIIDNRPTLSVENLENFYYDPTCGDDLDKAAFCILSFETCQADLKKEPNRYKNLEFVNWDAAAPLVDTNHANQSIDTNFNFKDPMRKRIVAYEYWGLYDINKTGILVPIVGTWIGDVCVRMEKNPFPDQKAPFVLAPYMPVKRQLLGEPDAEILEDNQKILGAVSRGMIDLLGRSANGQQGFAKGMLDVVNRRRFDAGQDYEFNPTQNPQANLIQHTYPEIPQSALVLLQMQNQEAEALTGVKAFSGGLSGNAYGDVAAGIKGILDAASKREMAILRRLANGLVKIGKKIISMNAVFLSDQEIIRITNKPVVGKPTNTDGSQEAPAYGMGHNGGPKFTKEDFVTVNRDDLAAAAEFDLKVDISTAEIDNNKAQDLAFMLQTMGNKMDFNVTKMILAEIARLKRMPELQHQIEEFQPQPDPMAVQIQQLQLEKLKKEIAEIDSNIALNNAKAGETQVKTEKHALDTIEQETGTKHARDMEKQSGQAQGNQALEVTKSLLAPKKEGEKHPDVEAAVGWNEVSKRMQDPRGVAQLSI